MGDFLIKLVRPDLAFSSLRDFIELGGDVLLAIMLATFIMWALIIERYWHFATSQKGLSKNAINHWNERSDHSSWYARRIREKLISEIKQSSERGLLYIKTLVAAAPLFGSRRWLEELACVVYAWFPPGFRGNNHRTLF